VTFNETQKAKIESLIKRGETMYSVAQAIGAGCTWKDIQGYCWQNGPMSWQGSKKIISNSLKKFPTAGTEDERKVLAARIDEQVGYLYYLGKEMRNRLLEVEKALEKLKI
jgi:hypothetical protein